MRLSIGMGVAALFAGGVAWFTGAMPGERARGEWTALDAAEEMLKQLDVAPGTESDRTVRVITLRNGDAAEIAKSLADIFETDDGTETPPVIKVNVASNSLLVRANAKQHTMLETIVSRLDSAALASSRSLKSVPLDPSKGNAEEIARLLRKMMEQANGEVEVITIDELLRRYDSQPDGGKDAPKSAPKPAGNSQSSAAPFDTTTAPARAFSSGWPPALPARLAFLALAFAQAAPVDAGAQADGKSGAKDEAKDGVTVAVDKDSNSLLLLGSPREIERAMKLIEQASKTLPGEASRVRSIKLPASADPAKIASVVNGAIARITPAGGQAGDLAKRVAVVADEETRSLIVVAGDRDFEAVGQLIAALARGQQAEQVVVKSFVLRNTGADRVAEALRSIITQGGGVKLRALAVTLAQDGGMGDTAVFDPTTVRVFAEKGANAVTVVGTPEAVAFADRFVAFADRADRSPVPELRLVPMKHAKASDVVKSLQTAILARSRALSAQGIVASVPEFSADDRTNMVVIAGGGEMSAEIERLLGVLDAPSPIAGAALETVAIMNGKPSEALATIEKVVFGANPSLRDHAQLVADDGAGVLLLRADASARDEIAKVIAELDRSAAKQFPIRQVKLERADAQRVATALQKLFDDRAAMAVGGRARPSQRAVSIVADVRSASLFVTASDADFAEIGELVKGFDAPETAKSLDFKVVALKHARAGDISASLEQLLAAMGAGGPDDMVSVRGDEKRNSVIIAGRGDRFAFANEFIAAIDVAPAEGDLRTVRIYEVRNGDIDQIAGLVRDTIGERQVRPWETQSSAAGSRVIPVSKSRKLVVRATDAQHAEIKTLLDSLEKTLVQEGRQSAVIPIQFAPPSELSATLKQFLDERAAAASGGASSATLVPSASGGALLVAGTADEISTIRDLVSRLDQPQSGGDRRSEIVVLRKAQAAEVAKLVGEQFRGRSGGQGVTISPDVRTNSIIVSAPPVQFEQVRALIDRLDAPSSADETIIRTFALKNAKAEDAVKLMTGALQLDSKGRTQGVAIRMDPGRPPVQVNARILADARSNSLVVTATPESYPVIEKLLSQLEESPAKAAVEFRLIPLQFAAAEEVATTLSKLAAGKEAGTGTEGPRIEADTVENRLVVAATAEQFKTIQDVVKAIDVRSERRRVTEFVPVLKGKARGIQEALSYFYGAGALDADTQTKQAVRIIADEATNSLVISADQGEWAGIRKLLEKLDTEQYDGSRQLRVVPLKHADARSVAKAINDAFEDTRPKPPQAAPRAPGQDPSFVVQQIKPEEYVSASADEFSNNLVIAASPSNMRKIDAIIAQLDLPDFGQLPPPRLIAVRYGNPEQLARSIERVYATGRDAGRARGLRIIGDATDDPA